MKLIPIFLDSLYSESSVPEIIKDFIERLSLLAEEDKVIALYYDSIVMKFEELLKLIEETDDNVNPFVEEMEFHSQNLKTKFKSNGLCHFDQKMRRKALISLLHKINRNIRLGKSIESINDLIGMEITLHTPLDYDTSESITELRKAVELTFEYFSDSTQHRGSKFSLCDATDLKDAISSEHLPDEIKQVQKINPKIFLPEKPIICEQFRNFGKDYVFRPKITTAYQGIQFVIKSDKGIYFEIQIKTQPMRDYLDVEDSPGNHKRHKNKQMEEKNQSNDFLLQFDVNFDPDKMHHIYGFRKNPLFDKSGVIQSIKWDLRKSTHPNNF